MFADPPPRHAMRGVLDAERNRAAAHQRYCADWREKHEYSLPTFHEAVGNDAIVRPHQSSNAWRG
jgi:hypothetical protein